MKKLIVVLLLLGALGLSAKEPDYLLLYTTTEKCYECSFRTAMICGENNPGCNVPSKLIYHTLFFNSLEKLLARMNEERKLDAYGFLSRIKWVRITPKNFAGVYKEMSRLVKQVKVGEVETEIMRPVRVKQDKKEWRIVEP